LKVSIIILSDSIYISSYNCSKAD